MRRIWGSVAWKLEALGVSSLLNLYNSREHDRIRDQYVRISSCLQLMFASFIFASSLPANTGTSEGSAMDNWNGEMYGHHVLYPF